MRDEVTARWGGRGGSHHVQNFECIEIINAHLTVDFAL